MLSKDPYTTETEYTYDEFRKMCLAMTLHDKKMMMVIAAMEAMFAIMTGVFIMLDLRAFMLIGLALLVAYPVFMISRVNTYIKDGFRILENNTRYYIFGPDTISYIIKKENCSPELLKKLAELKKEHGKEVKA